MLQKTAGVGLGRFFDPKKKDGKTYDKRVTEKAKAVLVCTGRLQTEGIPKLVVDTTADGVIGGFYDGLVAILRVLNDRIAPLDAEQKKCRDAALRLRQTAFPNGKAFLHQDMTVQHTAFRNLMGELDKPALRADVKTLGLGYQVRHLAAHLAPYGHAAMAPDGSSIEKASDDWHAAFEAFVIAVRDRYEGDQATIDELLGPYQKEVDAFVEANRVARVKRKAKKAKAQKAATKGE